MDLLDSFYVDNTNFIQFGTEHQLILLASLIFGIYFIYKGATHWDGIKRQKYALYLATVISFFQLFKMFIRMPIGNFDHTTDLPLHLCSLMPFVMLIIYGKNRKDLWAIFSLWIMAGTAQSLFTTTIEDSLPHYEAIRYWLVHGGLVILSLFGLIANKWRVSFSDIWKSSIAMNLAAAVVYPINLLLGSNYFFLNAKPPGTTLYSVLPEWPTYILCLEGVMLILFTFVVLLFKGIAYLQDWNQVIQPKDL